MLSFSNIRRSRPKSTKPADAPRLRDFSKTSQNGDHLNQCAGCSNVEVLIRQQLEQRKNDGNNDPAAVLHNSFPELDSCARNCEICRIFRQVLVLNEVTFDGVAQLRNTPGEVLVRWGETTDASGLARVFLKVELKGHPERVGIIDLHSRNNAVHLALRPDGLDAAVIQQAKHWLDTCRHHHVGQCDNLRWSSKSPPILIELLSPTSVRLRENQQGEYVALSYCWGKDALSVPDQTRVEEAKTSTKNVDRRRDGFPMSELPTTIRDALHIIRAMGIRYAWVDSLCIIQDKKDPVSGRPEGMGTMHLIYSNALFTLCASAGSNAMAKLLDKREAWAWKTEPCRLGGRWLTVPDMPLHELRRKSPLAARAWTLQEERLSPRILYVSSNRLHWSCAKGDELEMKPTYGGAKEAATTPLRRPLYAAAYDDEIATPLAQEFLLACYLGKSDQLHGYWADIVKSYAARGVGELADRLKALSGLAAKYLSASQDDEYLAGLWAHHLAEGLAWRTLRPIQTHEDIVSSKWPSWSWAAVPPVTALETVASSPRSPSFQKVALQSSQSANLARTADNPIESGEQVKQICVTGRTRSFWENSSSRVDWTAVSRLVDGNEVFSFEADPDQDVHAMHAETGRLLVYEKHKMEVIGKLDFQRDVEKMKIAPTFLKALELGLSTMLLLQDGGDGTWRRVGAAWGVRKDYFALAQRETLILC